MTRQVTGSLTLHGTTKTVTFTASIKKSGSTIAVSGDIPIAFSDYTISNPSFPPFVTTADNGLLEFTIGFMPASRERIPRYPRYAERVGRRIGPARAPALLLALALASAACARTTTSSTRIKDPSASVSPAPDYTHACAPSGPDDSVECFQVALQAIDNARHKEHVPPMALPADYAGLSPPQQLLIAVNDERVDRGLAPFAGLSAALNDSAATAASAGRLPKGPGSAYADADTEWIGDIANALDADFEWMYDDGPGSIDGCDRAGQSSCWADRHILLDSFGGDGSGHSVRVLGAALSPAADTTAGDVGGTSLAAILATTGTGTAGQLAYTWEEAKADIAAGTLAPRTALPANESATHIEDPPATVPASPDFTQTCAAGIDNSPACLTNVLSALNNARRAEGVKPMVLPADYAGLTVPQQLFVAVNLERVDRGLRPFAELTAPLNANAQKGADDANDPPDPGKAYDVIDTEWAGGSSNGLDAVYGWMYDDGIGSGNLDCPKGGGSGCWGHRHGILDNFGTVGTLVMGAAVNPTGDTGEDAGGTSMAATLAVTSQPAGVVTFTWAEVEGE